MISTRGRYALRVLVDLARNSSSGFVSMRDVARRQGISPKYLEQILPVLKKAGFVQSAPGRSGGYRLARSPKSCTVGEILSLAEGPLCPVACMEPDATSCPRAANCPTLPMWQAYYGMTRAFFEGITLEDLVEGRPIAPVSFAGQQDLES
ncbi:MAG: RrF2 family transcriptional regulator [Desulfovibrio sp.]|nr:RrF2 family transcriptional regulator [Desulfovibrio sp.]